MKVTPAIVKTEFIGLTAKVAGAANPGFVGIEGVVVNETRNTFTLQRDGKRKIVMKDHTVFHFALPDGAVVEIEGKTLVGKPEERLKKRIRRLW